MKTHSLKKGVSMLLAMVMCLTTFLGIGTTTAFAAGEQADVYLVGFPRDGDANYGGEWGHESHTFMNGWSSGNSRQTIIRAMNSYEGNICYCIEPGVPQNTGDSYTSWDENFWDNYPADYNHTISPDDIKLFIGRIMQYGYTGPISTSWRSQNEGGDKLAHAVATQYLVWETVVGERDEDFNKVSTGGADAILDQLSPNHPLYSQIMGYYNSMSASVQKHSTVPSFMAKSTGKVQNIELEWDGEKYTAVLTDTNGVLGNFSFTASESGIQFSISGNKLTITAQNAPGDSVRITAEKTNSQRRGVITWAGGGYGPNDNLQDVVTFAQSVSDPVKGYLNLKVSYGSAKIVKTSEDGKVDGIRFHISGNGVNQDVTTGANGEIQIDNLAPGVYTVTEQSYDKYEPQETRRVTVVSGQVATVSFSNVLKRGDLTVTKNSEDNLVEGVKFHLYGTSLSGLAVDEYAVTDSSGVARFEDVLIGSGYTLEEVDTAIRYVIPDSQSAAVEWNTVTNKSFTNILKKWNATVTKSDSETGTAQGNASLAGAIYGIFKGEQLIDTYTTDENGQFTTSYYVCGDDWSIREINPSEGYLLDTTVHHVGAEPELYTVEYNSTANDVTEQIIKGQIAIIKHTDNGDTQLETPEVGAEFSVYLKSAGGYDAAKDSERDYLVCDENGFAQTKELPYGIYTVHQTKGWDGRETLADFDVYIAKDGQVYRYLANNANFESYIKVIKVDAETGKTIPYAGAGFQLYRPDGSKVEMTFTYPEVTTIDTFYTNDEGYLITPEKLEYGSGYSLVEVSAPYGYVLNSEPVYFDVTADNATEDNAVTVVEVTKANMAQKGVIKISKTGEVFATVTESEGIYQPVYEVQGLPGAVYEITAAEDIYTLDGTLRYSAGEVVDAVKTTTDPDAAQEVATIDDSKKAILKDIFWQMNTISSRTETKTETVITETDDGHGNIVETEIQVTRTYLYITVSHMTADEMADHFSFSADQRAQLAELLSDENRSMWSAVLYGIGTGDGQIVAVALSQLGNVGGDPYWSWYGFGSRVEWCACFVSWCANECGYIDAGVIPKFAGCVNGVQWFKDRGLWQDNSYEPRSGDIIFFDWNNRGSSGPQDGLSDHVGIVERVENGIVYTVEGNSGDSCRNNHYAVGYYEILGYGTPAY